jgi:hypothetical protein
LGACFRCNPNFFSNFLLPLMSSRFVSSLLRKNDIIEKNRSRKFFFSLNVLQSSKWSDQIRSDQCRWLIKLERSVDQQTLLCKKYFHLFLCSLLFSNDYCLH